MAYSSCVCFSIKNYNLIFICFRNNSCEINLIDCFEKKEIHPELFEKSDVPKERDDPAGKYTSKLRKSTIKTFTKKAV